MVTGKNLCHSFHREGKKLFLLIEIYVILVDVPINVTLANVQTLINATTKNFTLEFYDPSMTYLLVDAAEVFQNVIHAVGLQHFTRVVLRKAVNLYTVFHIYVTLHEVTAGLLNYRYIPQVGCH